MITKSSDYRLALALESILDECELTHTYHISSAVRSGIAEVYGVVGDGDIARYNYAMQALEVALNQLLITIKIGRTIYDDGTSDESFSSDSD